jgi:UDP-2-acetamido-3-amino-2,3-dideoxy-glucuronate N-acetyltransferase
MIEQFSLSIEGIKVVEPVPYLTMVGIPATQIGWMSEYGEKLFFEGDKAICPHTNDEYILENNQVSKYYNL